MYVVIYMRINEDKNGLVFNGPYYGPSKDTMGSANNAAKLLADNTKNGTVVTKVFQISEEQSLAAAMLVARPIFDRMTRNMLEAKQIIDRPIARKSRKKLKQKLT